MKADERSRSREKGFEASDEIKVKDVNVLEAHNVSGAEVMQMRVENIKNNQEKGAVFRNRRHHVYRLSILPHSSTKRTSRAKFTVYRVPFPRNSGHEMHR